MDKILKDSRFTKLVNDPRFRQIPKAERKVKIDKRFQSMFENDKFKVKYTVDKRGRPVNQSSSENLRKYYDLSAEESEEDTSDEEAEDEDEEKSQASEEDEQNTTAGSFVRRPPSESEDDEEKNDDVEEKDEEQEDTELIRGAIPKNIKKKLRDLDVDYARGEGLLLTDSSSEEESSDEEEQTEHAWGELDADAETTEDSTNRLALCNMDWDNVKASDLFVLFNSFLPPGGLIKSVTIYPSEFGRKRMQEEELRGPLELTENKKEDNDNDSNGEDDEEGSKYHMEKLRKYQLNRLKYYYAVIVCDSVTSANKIYTDCDGTEYESSATKLDLRFIPEDVTFDEEAHDECLEVTDSSRYKPRLFTTTALQQARVQLTWDAANPHRTEALRGASNGEINDADLRNYLACSSSEAESDAEPEVKAEDDTEVVDPISKYKALLQDIETSENNKKNRGVEMEITWGMGLKEKTQELVKKKMTKGDKLTPFEELVEKRKEKKKAKKKERKEKREKSNKTEDSSDESSDMPDDVPSDIDMNDPYFAEEFDNPEFKKEKKSSKSKKKNKYNDDEEINEEEMKKRAELQLLLEDDDGKAHFSLKKIQEAEGETKSKRKRKQKEQLKNKGKIDNNERTAIQDFQINVDDKRFSALFTSHHYNIDPTDPNFKKTKAMDTLIQTKLKRRPAEDTPEEIEPKKSKQDAAMSVLIKSIKRKANAMKK